MHKDNINYIKKVDDKYFGKRVAIDIHNILIGDSVYNCKITIRYQELALKGKKA